MRMHVGDHTLILTCPHQHGQPHVDLGGHPGSPGGAVCGCVLVHLWQVRFLRTQQAIEVIGLQVATNCVD